MLAGAEEHQQQPHDDVAHQHERIKHPQIVQTPDDALELGGDFHVDVVVEARLEAEVLWQRRPVVAPNARPLITQLLLLQFQFSFFAVQLLLSPLQQQQRPQHQSKAFASSPDDFCVGWAGVHCTCSSSVEICDGAP